MQANSGRIIHHDGGTTFAGPDAVAVYRAITISSALRLYAHTGIKANRAYTPSAMLEVAAEITGKHFKRGQYAEASQALREWARKAREGMDVDARTPERTTEPDGKPIDV